MNMLLQQTKMKMFILTFFVFLINGLIFPQTEKQSTSESPAANINKEEKLSIKNDDNLLKSILKEPETLPEGENIFDVTILNIDNCILIALEKNYSLQNSQRDLLSSNSSLRSARAEFLPHVNISANTTYSVSDVNDFHTRHLNEGIGIDISQRVPTGGRNAGLSVNAEYGKDRFKYTPNDVIEDYRQYASNASAEFTHPLLKGAGREVGMSNLNLSKISNEQAKINYILDKRDVIVRVISEYNSILSSKLQIKVSQSAVEDRKRLHQEALIRYNLGLVAESEVLRAEVQLLSEQTNLISVMQAYEEALDSLLITLGLPLSEKIYIVEDIPSKKEIYAPMPELDECIKSALENRLEIKKSELSAKSAEIRYKVAANNVLPILDFFTSFSVSDSDRESKNAQGLTNPYYDVGLDFSMPFPNIENREARYQAKLDLETAKTNLDILIQNVTKDIKSAYRDLQTIKEQIKIDEKNLEQARKSLELENGRFKFGLNTSNDVIVAQDALLKAESNYIRRLLNFKIVYTNFLMTIGQPVSKYNEK